jgi:hypothetical protein
LLDLSNTGGWRAALFIFGRYYYGKLILWWEFHFLKYLGFFKNSLISVEYHGKKNWHKSLRLINACAKGFTGIGPLLSSTFTQVLILVKPMALGFNLHIKLAAFMVPSYHMFQILIICVKLWKSWRIMELYVKSRCLWACFHSLSPLSVVSAK